MSHMQKELVPVNVAHLGGQFLITCADQGEDVHPNRRYYWQMWKENQEMSGFHAFLPQNGQTGLYRYMDIVWLLLQDVQFEALTRLAEDWINENAGGPPHEFPPFDKMLPFVAMGNGLTGG